MNMLRWILDRKMAGKEVAGGGDSRPFGGMRGKIKSGGENHDSDSQNRDGGFFNFRAS